MFTLVVSCLHSIAFDWLLSASPYGITYLFTVSVSVVYILHVLFMTTATRTPSNSCRIATASLDEHAALQLKTENSSRGFTIFPMESNGSPLSHTLSRPCEYMSVCKCKV